MSESELIERYRQLLITLARQYVNMIDLAGKLKIAAEKEEGGGKKSGLYCRSRTISRTASILKGLLLEDGASLRLFFGTLNLHTIAKLKITFDK